MMTSNPNQTRIEHLFDYTAIHFAAHSVIDCENLDHLLQSVFTSQFSQTPLLIDMATIDGIYVEAFESFISALNLCHKHIALLVDAGAISEKYANLLLLSLDSNQAKACHSLKEAEYWLTH